VQQNATYNVFHESYKLNETTLHLNGIELRYF